MKGPIYLKQQAKKSTRDFPGKSTGVGATAFSRVSASYWQIEEGRKAVYAEVSALEMVL